MRGILGVRSLVRNCLIVGSICATEGVMRGNVANVRFKGSGVVHVGRESMKVWLVILQCLFVGGLVIRS